MKKLFAFALIALTTPSAFATGGFWCEYDRDGLKFEVNGVTTRSFEGAIVDLTAAIAGEMGDDGYVMKVDEKFVKTDVRQYWNLDSEFKLLLYKEVEDTNSIFSSTRVVLETKTSDDVDFQGTISIEHHGKNGSWSIEKAPIACGQE